jgi:ribosomal protein S18 acetylase RimI-like enzyme
MTDIDIKLTTEQDLLVLNELDHIARDDSSRQSFIEDATRTQRAWTIEDSKEIVGYGIISHEFFGRSFLELIYIDESKRSKGYGPELISFLEMQSKSVDLFTSTNESNSHMQHVLEKLGYERSGIIHNLDVGDPEIVYVKKGVCT